MRDGIPTEDRACLDWLGAFSQHLTATPSAYGVSPADALNMAGRVAAFSAAWAVAVNKATRTEGTIQARRQAKTQAVSLARLFVRQIKADAGVTDPAKRDAGIALPKTDRTPAALPTTAPALLLVGAVKGSMTLNYRDAMSPERRAKPVGIKALMLYRTIADKAAEDARDAVFYKAFTRGPIGVPFEPADAGKTVTFFACWANNRLEEGPMGMPVSMLIAA